MVSCVAKYMRWQVTGVGSNYVLKAVVRGEDSRIEHYIMGGDGLRAQVIPGRGPARSV